MSKITTVKGSGGKRYEVRSTRYGTSSLVQRLYYGGIYLGGTDVSGSMEATIEAANKRVDKLGIEIIDR